MKRLSSKDGPLIANIGCVVAIITIILFGIDIISERIEYMLGILGILLELYAIVLIVEDIF